VPDPAPVTRPELDKALAYLREGDVFVITRLSRAMRSLKHLLALADELRERGAGLVVLKQQIDTTTPTGRLVFHVLGAIDEFQRELIIEGTREGLESARARGRAGGRKPKLNAAKAATVRRMSRPPARTARGCTPSPRSPRPSACTAPPSTTTSRRSADMADGPKDATRHAGQVVRRVLLRRNIAIDAETAQLVAAAVQAALQPGAPSRRPRRRPRVPGAGSEPLF
jgi:Resolvase, N terminal domain